MRTWPNHAHGHLLYPRVFALAPPSCKRAVLWNPETSKLDDVSAPSECTAPAPGHGYLDAQAASFECLARSPKPFPLLILLEVQCLAGLLPHPTGKGPREALQPAIAGMVRKRDDDDATPLLTPLLTTRTGKTRTKRSDRGRCYGDLSKPTARNLHVAVTSLQKREIVKCEIVKREVVS